MRSGHRVVAAMVVVSALAFACSLIVDLGPLAEPDADQTDVDLDVDVADGWPDVGCDSAACDVTCRSIGASGGACVAGECRCGVDADGDADSGDLPDVSVDTAADLVDVRVDAADIDAFDVADGGIDLDAEVASDIPSEADGDVTPGTWAMIEPGSFLMGSSDAEPGRYPNETPHRVTLTHRFEILATEVNQAQFRAVMGYNPSRNGGCDECPVENVNWHESALYCNAISVVASAEECYACTGTGPLVNCAPSTSFVTPYECAGYRLPTEAEWEYVARAGTTTATYNGDLDSYHLGCESPNPILDPIAWYCGNTDATNPVALKAANAWAVFDMLGGVWEWCSDRHADDLGTEAVIDPFGPLAGPMVVYRGGSWYNDALFSRAAARFGGPPAGRSDRMGLRPVRTLP